MQTIISENYVELIGIIVVVALLIVYALLKKSENKVNEERFAKQKFDIKQEAKPAEKKVERVEETKVEVRVEEAEKPRVIVPINRKKRELLPHDKITKDDFATFKGTKILIAEDNIINQKVIAGLLSTSGIDIIIANDGQEALNILEKESDFAIIFMDAHMPVMDGFQATRSIRKNQKYDHIPIVALSGDTAADDIRNMLNVGMEEHIEKPLKMDALYDILYVYTNGKEAQNSSQEAHVSFDSTEGLEICGGDKDFYLEILSDFVSKYCGSADVIKKLINESDSTSANKILLDISGVAANIGAGDLHRIALDLKNSLSNPTDLEYINNLKKYKRTLDHVCEAIKEYARTK